jgi:hypothetical protein
MGLVWPGSVSPTRGLITERFLTISGDSLHSVPQWFIPIRPSRFKWHDDLLEQRLGAERGWRRWKCKAYVYNQHGELTRCCWVIRKRQRRGLFERIPTTIPILNGAVVGDHDSSSWGFSVGSNCLANGRTTTSLPTEMV